MSLDLPKPDDLGTLAARRIAICVRVCAGLTNEELDALEDGELAAMVKRNKPVRDALAEALAAGVLDGIREECCNCPSDGTEGFQCCGTPVDLKERAVRALALEE